MPRKETYSGPISAQAQQDLVSEGIENFELPKSVVMKIAKSSIPDNVKLQKETVLSLVKGSTVFINYLAATAHDVAQSKQHKSISASDVLKALETIEFSDMVNKLQGELLIFRELSKNDKGKKSTTTTTNGGGASSSASAKRGAGVAGASASAPPTTTTTATTKGKGKEKVVNTPTIGGSLLSDGFFNDVPGVPAFPHLPPHPHPHSSSSLVGGPFTSAPLDLPTAHSPIAHSPMDVDYDAEGSVSAAPPIPMTMGMGMVRPFQIEREDRERGLDGDEEEGGLGEQEQEEEVEEVGSEEEEAGEEEDLEDKELVEEQELRKDALGVEERSMVEDD